MNGMRDYVPLWVKSSFSFLEGASQPEDLVTHAQQIGLRALALTDRDGVYGVVHAHMRAKEAGMQLVLGAQVTLSDSLERAGKPVVVLCESRLGYGNLCQLITIGRMRSKKGESLALLDELSALAEGLVVLCPEPAFLEKLREPLGDRLFALVARHLCDEEKVSERLLRAAASACEVATVACNEVLYTTPPRKPLQDVLACIRAGKTLADAGRVTRQNAEHDLKSARAMRELFDDDPESLARTVAIAERCTFSLAELRYRYPGERIPEGLTESGYIRDLVEKGAELRYPSGVAPETRAQIDKELSIIQQLEYGGYFLTMREIVKFCEKNEILCQGRGSAANSVVCFCLGITAIDPIKHDLLFERFLSLERAEPPDIDLDIEHERREEVIQWLYQRNGFHYAAMVANVIRYRLRSAMRDVGKVLGLPSTAVDRLSKLMGGRFSDLGDDALIHAGLDPKASSSHMFLKLVEEIEEMPRHLSIHPGGFLLGHEPVDTLVPIEPATMEKRTVIQWDKYAVDDLGLFKVDLLGLGALSQIRGCLKLLREHHRRDLQMRTVPVDDEPTYRMISRGDTVGVFQIESRAQMSMLPRLKPKEFYDLVIEVAIVRPGPIQGDMVHPYLRRRNNEEQAEYPHPALKRVLGKTLGVPIFQEQVMKIATLVGGYSPGESDRLRRDMAAWKSSGKIERHYERLVTNMIKSGLTPEFAERIFSQIRGFGEYGFPESHAASFALIAYVTAWLRCHYPAAFTCSLLNAQPMGFYSPATLVEDAKLHGIAVLPIDVQHSAWDCTLELQPGGAHAVRMGLRYVKGLSTRERERLEREPPPYRDLEDFVRRTKLNQGACQKLAESGALDAITDGRRDAIWEARELFTRVTDPLELGSSDGSTQSAELFTELRPIEEVLWDYRRTHHSTRGHPMQGLRAELARRGMPTARELNALRDGSYARYVGMTICRQRPGTATGVTFYTLEDETGFVNLVVWKQIFDAHAVVARTALLMGVSGKIQSESGVIHLVADTLWEPPMTFAAEGTSTRNFH
jgi:error-prone DNA polymerase